MPARIRLNDVPVLITGPSPPIRTHAHFLKLVDLMSLGRLQQSVSPLLDYRIRILSDAVRLRLGLRLLVLLIPLRMSRMVPSILSNYRLGTRQAILRLYQGQSLTNWILSFGFLRGRVSISLIQLLLNWLKARTLLI